ncbi:Dbl homology domain-containing protein [Hesseltinella vesiculosa]|uniref:Dbl homology domain-containing protein n=1 Tax=Hesseltinella vesiculosa TaxID=101127 RepID=A0A1X2GPB7_9FUNG|nr:Dbl homology domain-containing protein [Hesseltinella vesiculosa]
MTIFPLTKYKTSKLSILSNVPTFKLETTEKHYRKRQILVQKLFDYESDYVNRLHACRNYFERPLLKHFQTPKSMSPRLAQSDIMALFEPVNHLFQAHESFLDNLIQRFQIWGPTQLLSDVLMQLVNNVGVYDRYFERFPQMMSILETLGRNKEALKLLEANVTNPGGIGQVHLFTLLEMPLYAFSQYFHFVTELRKMTDPTHPDARNLQKLQFHLARIDKEIKPRFNICRNISQLIDVSLTVRDCPLLMDQPRQFLKSGRLMCAEGKPNADVRACFLLSDHLILARPVDKGLVYKAKIKIKHITIKAIRRNSASFVLAVDDSPDHTRQLSEDLGDLLSAAGAAPTKEYVLKADSLEEMLAWVRDLQDAIQNVQRR